MFLKWKCPTHHILTRFSLRNLSAGNLRETFTSKKRDDVTTTSETVNTRRVLILQKYALRILSFSPPRTPSAPIFKTFKILTIFDLVKTLNILFVHQHLNLNLPPDLCNSITFDEIDHNYSTRCQSLGLIKRPKVSTTTYGLKSLCIQSITQWNILKRLHPNISLVELSPRSLKLLVKSDILSNY